MPDEDGRISMHGFERTGHVESSWLQQELGIRIKPLDVEAHLWHKLVLESWCAQWCIDEVDKSLRAEISRWSKMDCRREGGIWWLDRPITIWGIRIEMSTFYHCCGSSCSVITALYKYPLISLHEIELQRIAIAKLYLAGLLKHEHPSLLAARSVKPSIPIQP